MLDANLMSAPSSLLIKRSLDVLLSGLLLLVCLPLLLVVAGLVWLEDQGPIFYRQDRIGQQGRPFRLLKIRSMKVNDLPPEEVGEVRAGNPMVTRVGRVIRRLKIDELPQILNVFRGDMSFVGPRPTLQSQAEQYDAAQARRLDVRPGLTGWAQVNGNTQLTWEERIHLDLWYIDHWSLGLDLIILGKTVGVVLGGEVPNPVAVKEAIDHANRADWRR